MRRPSVIVLDMTDLLRRVEIAETERADLAKQVETLKLENGTLIDDAGSRDWKIEELEREVRQLRGVKPSAYP